MHFGADLAVFVTTTRFSRPSERFAVQHGILAVHRDHLGLWNHGASLLPLSEVNGRGPRRLPALGTLEARVREMTGVAGALGRPVMSDVLQAASVSATPVVRPETPTPTTTTVKALCSVPMLTDCPAGDSANQRAHRRLREEQRPPADVL